VKTTDEALAVGAGCENQQLKEIPKWSTLLISFAA